MRVTIEKNLLPFIKSLANLRTNVHKGQNSTEIYNEKYEELGIIGELAFEILVDRPMDKSIKPYGDTCDFKINNFYIDVKATRTNKLYVKERKLQVGFIYVLGRVNYSKLYVDFLGWTFGSFVKNQAFFLKEKRLFIFPSNKLFPIVLLQPLLNITLKNK